MSSTRSGDILELRGPPRRLSAVVPLALPAHGAVPVRIARQGKGGAPADLFARVSPFGTGATEIRLQLPRDLPPGRYEGVATIAGNERRVQLDVEENIRLRVHPRENRLVVAPGKRAEIQLHVANVGNAEVEIPSVAAFGIFEEGGIDTAIGRTLRADLKPGERRVDRLMDELAERHGGLVRVGITKGGGALAAGASVEITATLEIPDGLTAGHRYSGVWPLANINHRVVLEVDATGRKGREQ